MRKKVIIIVLFSFLLNCKTKGEKVNYEKPLEGKWTFIKFNKEVYDDYFEVEFLEGDKMKISSRDDVSLGQIDYSINRDIISFSNQDFTLNRNVGKMEFLGEKNKYILYRIPFNLENIDRNQINPIYARKGYFLLHLNQIKFDSLVNYLNMVVEPINPNEILEENIPINNKKD